MIAHVRGRVAHRDADAVVVDVGGVGYLVRVADPGAVPPVGQDTELHTSLQVREDAMDLYGFTTRTGLQTFELLISASGIGPKLGLAALRTHRPEVLRDALAMGDTATLTAIPGVGRKVAERLVLELRDKVGGVADAHEVADAGAGPTTPLSEARQALSQLGYTNAEIQAALAAAPDDAGTEELVRHALRSAGAGR